MSANATPITQREKLFAYKMGKLSDPIRLRMICFLCHHDRSCVSKIAEAFNIPLANASHHLRSLKEAGVLKSEREGKTVCYMLSKDAFATEFKKFISQLEIV